MENRNVFLITGLHLTDYPCHSGGNCLSVCITVWFEFLKLLWVCRFPSLECTYWFVSLFGSRPNGGLTASFPSSDPVSCGNEVVKPPFYLIYLCLHWCQSHVFVISAWLKWTALPDEAYNRILPILETNTEGGFLILVEQMKGLFVT